MTETAERTGDTGQPDPSTAEQAKDKVQETAQQVQQKAVEVKGQAGDRVRRELDSRSTEAGSQLGATAEAMRRTGDQLRDEGKDAPAKIVTAVADRAERLGSYMTHANADQMVRDVENFARRQPLLFAFGGATVGFLASRFMKASSSNRYQGSGGSGSSQTGSQPMIGPGKAYGELPESTAGQAGGYSAEPQPSTTAEPASLATTGSKRGGSSGKSGQ